MYTKQAHNNIIAHSMRQMGFIANATPEAITVGLSRRRIEIAEVIIALDAAFPGIGFEVSRKSDREVEVR